MAVAMVRAAREREEWFGEGSAFASAERLAAALQELADGREADPDLAPSSAGGAPVSAEARRARLRAVIAGRGIRAVYQPIVDLDDGRLSGVEAAARFGSGLPSQWFADAQEAGLGAELELSAAATALAGLGALPRRAYLSLTLSASTLLRPETAGLLGTAPLHRIVVEMRLHEETPDTQRIGAILHPLRESGLRLAVDAIGAGALSLRELASLSPDIVKIDAPSIVGAGSDATPERTLGRVVVAFAERMGTVVVGERVEDRQDLRGLRDLGVRYGQGFLLARPGALPVDEGQIVELVGTGLRRPIWMRRFPPPWSPG